MAKGDLRSSRSSYVGGGGYSYDYDDQGRGTSKTLWEEFEAFFKESGYESAWLLNDNSEQRLSISLYDARLYKYIHNMTKRYTLHDWAWGKFTDDENNDGRVRRLVIKKCGIDVWHQLQRRAKLVWDKVKEQEKKRSKKRSAEGAQERAAFQAEQIKRQEEENTAIMQQVDLVAGMIESDFNQAFTHQERYGQDEGDWLDDPVSSYTSGYGMGEETKQAHGTKMQITLSIDLSNSMYYNDVSIAAADSFRDIWLALEQLQQENPSDMFVGCFEFSKDSGSGRGKYANCLSVDWHDNQRISTKSDLGAVESYRHSSRWHFSGEDTWMYPLFEEIEKWENAHSDPGAVRLDLIISDAVLEHKVDITRSDKIQERRDGTLQSVILNLMPEKEWVNSDLPMRCVQYAANAKNLGGMLRNVISEFTSAYM